MEIASAARLSVLRTLGLVIFLGATLLAMHGFGRSARTFGTSEELRQGPPVRVVHNALEAIEAFQTSGLRGRILVHCGQFLHFIRPDETYGPAKLADYPYEIGERLKVHRGDPSMLWFLIRTNIARQVVNVLPPEVYDKKIAPPDAPRAPLGARRRDDDGFEGLRRTFVDYVPDIEEPILLSVDGSLFASDSGRALASQLLQSSLRSDLVIANLAEDNPRVTEEQREALRQFADGLAGEGRGR